jgi:hypothetical protein
VLQHLHSLYHVLQPQERIVLPEHSLFTVEMQRQCRDRCWQESLSLRFCGLERSRELTLSFLQIQQEVTTLQSHLRPRIAIPRLSITGNESLKSYGQEKFQGPILSSHPPRLRITTHPNRPQPLRIAIPRPPITGNGSLKSCGRVKFQGPTSSSHPTRPRVTTHPNRPQPLRIAIQRL